METAQTIDDTSNTGTSQVSDHILDNFGRLERSWEKKMIRLKLIHLIADETQDMTSKDFELISLYIKSLASSYSIAFTF